MRFAPLFISARVSTVACWLCVALVFPPLALASPTELTLEQAVRIAVARAPLIDASRAGIAAAREEAARAGALPDPVLTVGIANLPVTGADAFDPNADFMTMKNIGLRQEVPSHAKREARASLAQREVEEARAIAISTRLGVRRATANAWIRSWAARRELVALQALREQARLAADLAKARVSGGGASVGDALAAAAAGLELDNRIEAAQAELSVVQAGLARWLGEDAAVVAGDSSMFEVLPNSQAQLVAAIDRLGPLLPTIARVEAAAGAIDVARAEKRPDWSVAVSYGQRTGGSDMLMFEVGIGLPLFARNRQDRGIAAREAEYRAALAMREDLRREEVARIRAGIARWEGLKRQIDLHEDALLPLARDRSRAALAAYRAGGSLQPWLDARRDELAVHLSHVTHLRELGLAWVELAFLLPEDAS